MRRAARRGRADRLALLALLLVPAGAGAQDCTAPGPLPAAAPPHALRFGVAPQLAGSAGAVQEPAKPLDEGATLAALRALRPPGRDLVVRLNRMFWSDGDTGLAQFAALADRYAANGDLVSLQVRYHPPAGHDGDIAGWVDYVRRAVDTFAPRPAVVELSITNEGNLPGSANTSDGSYKDVPDAIVQGVLAARAEADRLGRRDLKLGFTYAYRSTPAGDTAFFSAIGAKATPAFAAAVDHVGLQVYPGLFFPPATTNAPQDVVDAATLLRTCLMPKAGLGPSTSIWVTENGYATRGGQGEDRQASDLTGTVDALAAQSGTLGIADYDYFNLRDNNSTGADLFDAVGLLFDDGRAKQSFGAYRSLIGRYGAAVAPKRRLAMRVTPRRVHRRRRVTLRVLTEPGALVRVGHRHVRTNRDGRARLRIRFVGRPGLRTVRATKAGLGAAVLHVRVLR